MDVAAWFVARADLLMTFGLGMLAASLIIAVCLMSVPTDDWEEPSIQKQLLMQIELGEDELRQLTQAYLQQMELQANSSSTATGSERTQANRSTVASQQGKEQ